MGVERGDVGCEKAGGSCNDMQFHMWKGEPARRADRHQMSVQGSQ